jgi:uroporphyrinogen-III synthase
MTASDDPCELAGLRVLVTRPARQASALCTLIEQQGGIAVRFPALEITPGGSPADHRRLARAAEYDLLIFVSVNAVAFGEPLLPPGLATPVAAVGTATAKALWRLGIEDVLLPDGRADSENLLSLPALKSVAGKRILIVRGEGGRPLLGNTLTDRGARVDYAEVYRRQMPATDPRPLLEHWDTAVDVVTASSGEVLANLCRLLDNAPALFATPLVVVSERTAEDARARGFTRVAVSPGATDGQVCQALCALARAVRTSLPTDRA